MGKTAASFLTTANYSAGDLVLYDGKLYVFTSNHSAGAWDDSDVATYDNLTELDVARIIAGSENAQKATAYVDTISISVQAIVSGSRYKGILTNAEDPRN